MMASNPEEEAEIGVLEILEADVSLVRTTKEVMTMVRRTMVTKTKVTTKEDRAQEKWTVVTEATQGKVAGHSSSTTIETFRATKMTKGTNHTVNGMVAVDRTMVVTVNETIKTKTLETTIGGLNSMNNLKRMSMVIEWLRKTEDLIKACLITRRRNRDFRPKDRIENLSFSISMICLKRTCMEHRQWDAPEVPQKPVETKTDKLAANLGQIRHLKNGEKH